MQFSDTSTNSGIIQKIEALLFNEYGKISGNSQLLSLFTSYSNSSLDKVATWIMEADGRWHWEDDNNTDYPIGTTSLVTDQQDYQLATEHLRILRVEVQDTAGTWWKLKPFDEQDIFDQSLTDFLKTSGRPMYYDVMGSSLFLYPKPNYSQAASLKVYFQRQPSYFTTGDTTKSPGINRLFHQLIVLLCAYDYAFSNRMPIKDDLNLEISKWKDDLQTFYALRQPDDRPRLKIRPTKYN